MMIKEPEHDRKACNQNIMAVHDAMDILNGRWKISIIASLCFNTLRFTDLLREVEGISGKMLSRELKKSGRKPIGYAYCFKNSTHNCRVSTDRIWAYIKRRNRFFSKMGS
ncbi:hypothetical protein AAGS39_24560 [Flavobacterium sp. CGRL2]